MSKFWLPLANVLLLSSFSICSTSFAQASKCTNLSGYYVGSDKHYLIRQQGCSYISISHIEFGLSPGGLDKNDTWVNTDIYTIDGNAYGLAKQESQWAKPQEKIGTTWKYSSHVEISEANDYRIATLDDHGLTIFEHETHSAFASVPMKETKCALTPVEAIQNPRASTSNGCIIRIKKFEKSANGSLVYSSSGFAFGTVEAFGPWNYSPRTQ